MTPVFARLKRSAEGSIEDVILNPKKAGIFTSELILAKTTLHY